MVVKLGPGVKSKLRRMRKGTKNRGLAERCQIVLLAGRGKTQAAIAEGVGCSVSRVSHVLKRFRLDGPAGLIDRREDNGTLKLTEDFLNVLYQLVDDVPTSYGYLRPTWTRELLVLVMEEKLGTKVHVGTMSRALAQIGARRGKPKPIVLCPWKKRKRQRRLAEIRRLLANLRRNEVAVYVDEVDIHLNPKIGLDWMNCGTQKQVRTPGQNEKCYLAGALDARSGRLTWVGAQSKNSTLFIDLLRELDRRYPQASVIHVILDNYKIHKSKQVQAALATFGSRIRLHFLPPYCPDENRIERVWSDLHDNVTRNHRCRTMTELIDNVLRYLRDRNQVGPQPLSRKAA
jgi:transposase